jgi:hypothetical protein
MEPRFLYLLNKKAGRCGLHTVLFSFWIIFLLLLLHCHLVYVKDIEKRLQGKDVKESVLKITIPRLTQNGSRILISDPKLLS